MSMMPRLFGKKEKSLSEIEEDTEKAQAENDLAGAQLSLAQKKEAIRQLKERGLTPKHFGMDFAKIIKFLKEH